MFIISNNNCLFMSKFNWSSLKRKSINFKWSFNSFFCFFLFLLASSSFFSSFCSSCSSFLFLSFSSSFYSFDLFQMKIVGKTKKGKECKKTDLCFVKETNSWNSLLLKRAKPEALVPCKLQHLYQGDLSLMERNALINE